MPLYEYQCKACGHLFEKIQKFSDPEEKVCPKCGSEVERLLSAPAVQFKGSGWYVTDYAGKGANNAAASSSKDGDGAKKESKPAASSESSASNSKPESSTSTKSE